MRLAITVHGQRISPLFDTATRIQLVDTDRGRVARSKLLALGSADSTERVKRLVDQGVELLICGGVRRPTREQLAAAGIEAIGWVSGPVDDVLHLVQHRLTAAEQGPHPSPCLAICAEGPELDGPVAPTLGRAPCLVLARGAGDVRAVGNPPPPGRAPAGAGTVRRIAELGATHVVATACGPNVRGLLRLAGIELVVPGGSTVRAAIRSALRPPKTNSPPSEGVRTERMTP